MALSDRDARVLLCNASFAVCGKPRRLYASQQRKGLSKTLSIHGLGQVAQLEWTIILCHLVGKYSQKTLHRIFSSVYH